MMDLAQCVVSLCCVEKQSITSIVSNNVRVSCEAWNSLMLFRAMFFIHRIHSICDLTGTSKSNRT